MIRLAPCIVVEGRVVGPDGEGVPAWVNAWSTAGGNAGTAYANTAPDGTFRLEDLPAGGVRLMVSSQGFGSADLTLEPIPPGETKTGVEIRLQAGVRVAGVLVDQDGPARGESPTRLHAPQRRRAGADRHGRGRSLRDRPRAEGPPPGAGLRVAGQRLDARPARQAVRQPRRRPPTDRARAGAHGRGGHGVGPGRSAGAHLPRDDLTRRGRPGDHLAGARVQLGRTPTRW